MNARGRGRTLKGKDQRSGAPGRAWSSMILLAAGVVLMLVGVYRGELPQVLIKAVTICLECIGIG